MPYMVIATYTRPNASVSWPDEVNFDPALRQQMEEDIHALAWGRKTRSPALYVGDLTVIYESVWDTKEIYDQYRALPTVIQYFDLVHAYCNSAGITLTIEKNDI